MSEDASLDDFLGDESSEQSGTGDETDPSAPDDSVESGAAAADEPEPATDIEPATTTYAWSGEGAACDECNEPARQRWQQAGALVCIECKDWERA